MADSVSATLAISVTAQTIPIVGSSNWSGYVAGNGPFTTASGTFSVPHLVAGTASTDSMAEWVGIGGEPGIPLIQAGITESPDPSNSNLFSVQPWWEVFPAVPVSVSITNVSVSAGDEISVDINQISGIEWSITLTDDTNGEGFTTDQTYTGAGSTAEWIVEAPEVNGHLVPLAQYYPYVEFSDLQVAPVNTTLEELEMYQGGSLVSAPSAHTRGGFNVAYGDIAPAAP
jgi:hypothetical protein